MLMKSPQYLFCSNVKLDKRIKEIVRKTHGYYWKIHYNIVELNADPEKVFLKSMSRHYHNCVVQLNFSIISYAHKV